MRRIRGWICAGGHGVVMAFALLLVVASTAHAITAGTGITTTNGVISLVSPVVVANGGTGLTAAADDATVVGNGTAWVSATLPTCSGATNALSYNISTNAFGCNTITGGAAVNPVLDFASETKIDLNGSTIYLGLGGGVSATENDVLVPISAATLNNLRCRSSVAPGGTSLTVTFGTGACTGAMTYGTSSVVLPATTDTTAADTDAQTVTAGQCIALKVVAVGDTSAAFVTCTIDKTA